MFVSMAPNIWVLMMASALGMCVAPLVVFIGGIVGAQLAPNPNLATLPVAALVIGTAIAVIPVSRLMQLYGRKRVFLVNALVAAAGACLAAMSIHYGSFWGFCLSIIILGGSLAVIQQFRFAAMESVPAVQSAKAASMVLLGGLIAAFLGPEIAHIGKGLTSVDFMGSFLLLALVVLLGGVVLLKFDAQVDPSHSEEVIAGRSLGALLHQPALWVAVASAGVGYAVMSYIMTATPVSMHHMQGHSLADTKWVIQSHICAMFLPSFFSGQLIARFGVRAIMVAGLIIYLVCGLIALSGQDLMHYWLGLVLLGVGWNFLFVAGTALLPTCYEPAERFKVQGFNDFVVFGCQAFASLSSGIVIFNFGWNPLILFSAPVLTVLIVLIWHWTRSERRQREVESDQK